MSKMYWLAEKHINNLQENKIKKTNYRYGVVKQPTGTGKSSVIFDDIIQNICNKKKKQIFIICSHILNLNEQTFKDLFDLNTHIGFMNNYKTCVVLNSSVSDDNYVDFTYDTNTDIIKDIKKLEGFSNSEYDIAFVSSCNESFDKLWNLKFEKDVEVICYIDECHNIVSYIDKNKKGFEKFFKKCYKLYGLSATPSKFVKIINKLNNSNIVIKGQYLAEDECIVDMSAADAIKNNYIIKPFVKTIHTVDGQITSDVIYNAMQDAVSTNSSPIHKMLVTCFSINEANNLAKECEEKYGMKVFKNTSADNWNISDFCNEVEKCQENCVIFHCRKLIQGIDIKSITDAIISNNSNQDIEREIRIIQIIGRAIRTANGEYGKDIDQRDKKFANIYFISNGTEEYDKAIARIVIRYYGLNNIIIENNENIKGYNPLGHLLDEHNNINKINNSDAFKEIKLSIDHLMINFKNYIEKHIITMYNTVLSEGGYITPQTLLSTINWGSLTSDNTTLSMFDHDMQLDALKEVFKNNGITL